MFDVDVDRRVSYPKDLDFRVNEVPYFMPPAQRGVL